MESYKKTSSERMGLLKAGVEGAAGIEAGGEGPLRMRCCVAEVFNSIIA